MVGLAEADEVPDMFILRNLKPVNEGDRWGPHTGDKEIASIEQVVAAEEPREPPAARAQKVSNVGYVYVTAAGQTPDPALFGLQRELRDRTIEFWSHVTGGRSQITTTVPRVANRSPVAVGALAEHAVGVGGEVAVDVGAAFRDPHGDPLTYEATSSAPAVATVAVSGSTVSVRGVAAGPTRITVTGTDIGGSNTTARLRFGVTVRAEATFTDDPIQPGVTPIRALHFTELRDRIDLLRTAAGLGRFAWTERVLAAGVTPVRLAHLLELRSAVAGAYAAAGVSTPRWTDTAPVEGTPPIRAELREAVKRLER